MSGCQFLMESAATSHIKVTVKTTDEKYYLGFGGGDEGVARWSGILADNCVRSSATIKTDLEHIKQY